ncbi:MAG: EAL domain-containing protein, partial [Rhodospirillales bacterium]|nr:EAL domain-containing protein [Rhodospirillales bacterium]
LGMQVCAEGIETTPQLAFLREAGCNLLQGYLLGRPRPEPMLDASPLVLPDAG